MGDGREHGDDAREDRHRFVVELYPGGIDPETVGVELYAEPMHEADSVRMPMNREPMGLGGGCVYVCEVPASRRASDAWVLWQDRRGP